MGQQLGLAGGVEGDHIADTLTAALCLYKCRYRLSGLIIPGLKEWFESTFGANLQHKTPATVSVIQYFIRESLWIGRLTVTNHMVVFIPGHSEQQCCTASNP